MTDKEFAKEQYEQLKRYAEFVWQSMPDGPERMQRRLKNAKQ